MSGHSSEETHESMAKGNPQSEDSVNDERKSPKKKYRRAGPKKPEDELDNESVLSSESFTDFSKIRQSDASGSRRSKRLKEIEPEKVE
mmetsp:Transcript_32576/g.29434  ORF Transcript_32576/g.29434 Transcript_32576/m.29434 type:complete len:88 (+) Transcript_32576:636-899(+)